MPTTYYHTINGRIVGQTRNGVRTHYVPDALGSVVATLDANGTVENTYRYKPYGSLLAKTGTGDDPRFMWGGSVGVKQLTGTSLVEFRTRVYLPKAAGATYAQFVGNLLMSPTSTRFLHGNRGRSCPPKMVFEAIDPPLGDCGVGGVRWAIEFDPGCDNDDGWIIQYVVWDWSKLEHCELGTVNPEDKYYEGWQVRRPRNDPRAPHQAWRTSKQPVPQGWQTYTPAADTFALRAVRGYPNYKGTIEVKGWFGYKRGEVKGWTEEVISSAEDMPTSRKDPTNGSLPFDQTVFARHFARFSFNCCADSTSRKTTLDYAPRDFVYGGVG